MSGLSPAALPATESEVIPMPTGNGVYPSASVLLVEQDVHTRELVSHFLKEAGHILQYATNGETALELVQFSRPDVVITEVLIPRMDGLALCRRIKEDPELSDTAVLVLSILSARERATAAGADAFLRKPLSEGVLLEAVDRLMTVGSRR